jgi:hypothetical protein
MLTSASTLRQKAPGAVALADAILSRPTLKDYAVEGVAIGNAGATRTFDLTARQLFFGHD